MMMTTRKEDLTGRTEDYQTSAMTMNDEQLLMKYRDSGDEQLLSELVGRYERELFSYLRPFPW